VSTFRIWLTASWPVIPSPRASRGENHLFADRPWSVPQHALDSRSSRSLPLADHPCPLFLVRKSHRRQVERLPRVARQGHDRGVRLLRIAPPFVPDPHSSEALDDLHLKRYCCRRMVLTHVDLIEKLLHYNRECFPCRINRPCAQPKHLTPHQRWNAQRKKQTIRHNLTLCSFTYVPIGIRFLSPYIALRRMWMLSNSSGHSIFKYSNLAGPDIHNSASSHVCLPVDRTQNRTFLPHLHSLPGLVRAHRYRHTSLPQFRAPSTRVVAPVVSFLTHWISAAFGDQASIPNPEGWSKTVR